MGHEKCFDLHDILTGVLGLKWRRRRRTQDLNPDQKKRRYNFGLEHDDESESYWRNVLKTDRKIVSSPNQDLTLLLKSLWSDEKWWSVTAPRNRSMDGAWVEDPSEVPSMTEKKWDEKVMVWGAFTAQGVCELHFLKKRRGKKTLNGEY